MTSDIDGHYDFVCQRMPINAESSGQGLVLKF